MVSLITSSNARNLIFPVVSSIGLGTNLAIRKPAALLAVNKDRFGGFKESKKTGTLSAVLCKGSLESEAELVQLDLEREILEFMKISKNPNDFPTKNELLDAGRIDLVNAIIKKGGWLSLGWDDSDDENEWNRKEFDKHTKLEPSLSCSSSNQCDSPSSRSLETVVQEDAGIEGILHRLEEHRSLSFGISMQENGHTTYASSKEKAAEYYYSKDKVFITQGDAEIQEGHGEINSNYIKSRIQQMQLELSSSLCLLRSKSETNDSEGHKNSPSELQQLSDTWEFRENEIMNAKDRLRSIRAEIAVLQGKMTLSISDAQRKIEEKQRRIDSGYKTLQLLHTTCIIWPNSASEVLLAGSFDGWSTQRKMERSSAGVFSLSLKLYPGRYEMKFIVDGVWRVDPLRPIANNNGYENNVLIVPD